MDETQREGEVIRLRDASVEEVAGGQAANRFQRQFQDVAEIAAHLVAESNLTRVYEGIVDGARRLLGADRCAVFARRWDGTGFECGASYGLSDDYIRAVVGLGDNAPAMRALQAEGGIVVFEDVATEARAKPIRAALQREGVRSLIIVPLRHEGRLNGALICYGSRPARITASDRSLIGLFATLMASATQNCLLHHQNNRHAERLRVLSEIGVAVSRVLDLDSLYEEVYRQAGRVLCTDAFYVATWHPERQSLLYHLVIDRGQVNRTAVERPFGDGPSSWVVRHGKPYIMGGEGDNVQDGGFAFGCGERSQSAIHVPLLLGDRIIGVMSAQSYQANAYSAEDVELLSGIATQTAVAIENARLFRLQALVVDENRRLNAIGDLHGERLEALNEIGVALSSTLDLETLYGTLYGQVRRVLKADCFYIALWNRETNTISYPFQADDGEQITAEDTPLGDGPTSRALLSGRPVVVDEPGVSEAEAGRLFGTGLPSASALHVPMVLDSEVIGVMSVQSYEAGAYSAEDLRMLQTVAAQTAVAIGNARLFASTAAALEENRRLTAESRRRAERLRVLNEAGIALSRALHRDDLNQCVFQQTSRVLPVDSFYIALWNAERRTLSYSMFERDRVSNNKMEAPLSDGPSSWVIRNKRPYIVQNSDDPVHMAGFNYGDGPDIRSAIHVPLLMGDRVIGAMSAQSYQRYTYSEEDVHLLETLASQAAVALENARLYEAVRDASLTDELTGLPNRRAIANRLNEELSRSARYGHALSVLLLDLDYFKRVNDTYGHPAGDSVLRELAILLRGSLRAHDGLGRWGGEEFLVVLVHTDKVGGEVVAENLRSAVERHTFRAGGELLKMTASIGGVALEMPLSADPSRLLDAVDACLYRAKAEGRNRVVFGSGPPDILSQIELEG